jgi:hypothetical protein
MLSAVDFFIQHYYEHEVPKVKDVVQMFFEKQEQRLAWEQVRPASTGKPFFGLVLGASWAVLHTSN